MSNTALGEYALNNNQTGSGNTAVGGQTLFDNLGDGNTAVGSVALFANSTGTLNTAVGAAALNRKVTGSRNIAIGAYAGSNLADGMNNIFIGNRGVALAETGVIRIGDSNQSQTFIAAVRGVTTAHADAVPVYIDSSGQLGTAVSSRALKQDFPEMRDATRTIMILRPVEFAHQPDSPLQYGLIAEEVAEVAPDLVARNSDGEIMTVHYDKVNVMLLNHVQKLAREKEALANSVRELEARVTELESRSK